MRGRHVAGVVAATALVALGAGSQAIALAPSATLDIAFAPGSPAPPVLNQNYGYAIGVGNDGDVALDNLVIVDTVPVELRLSSVTTGSYTSLGEFAAGEGVRVSYEKNTALGVFTLWGSSPNVTTNTNLTVPPPGLGAGEYVTRVRWEYGQAAPGMRATVRPVVAGRVINPDNSGGPVAVGDTIQNCATLTAVHTAGPTNVSRNACRTFQLIAGPAVTIAAPDSTPRGSAMRATATLSGGDPTGTLAFRVFAAGDAACADALFDGAVSVDGVGPYVGPEFPASAAGAFKWVAFYGGDVLHAPGQSGCSDPAGAFAVVAPPALSASFAPATIAVGETAALSFTIVNPAANTVPLTGVELENALPDGLAVASPNGLTGSCGAGTITAAPGSQSVTLAGGTIAVGSQCSFAVDVIASEHGEVTNTSEAVQSANGGSGNAATASLTVFAEPVVTIAAPDSTPLGSPTRATATLSGGDPTGTLAFRLFAAGDALCADALLEGDVIVDGVGPYVGPEFPASAAGAFKWVAFYGGDVLHALAESGCSDPAGAFAVVAPPLLSASFAPASIAVGETTALSFTIANPAANTVALTGVGLVNALPDGLAVASPNGLSGSCGAGTITVGSQSVTLAGGTIAVGSECSFSIDVTASEQGDVTNTSEAVQSANGGSGNTAIAPLRVIARPSVTIAVPDSTPLGSPTRATATLTGGDPTGTLTFRLFAAGDTPCADALLEEVVPVDGAGPYEGPEFLASAAGAYEWVARYGGDDFHAPAESGCSDPAGAFAVVAPPLLSASFAPATIAVGETTALSFTIANPAANTVPLTGVELENELPDGLAVASPNGLTGSCGAGTITVGSQSVTLAGGTIAVGSECSFSIDVTASEQGDVTNTSEAVQSANGGSGNAATASLTVTAPPVIPPEPQPEPKPPPAGAAPAVPDVPAAVMRLRVPRLSVFGRSAAARCTMRAGEINYCAVRLRARGRLVARGRTENLDEPGPSLDVALRLTRRGRALLARRLGGVRARVRAVAATSDGERRARARTRAILKVERFTTPPGSWEPDEVAFTRRGERFLRGLRERLVAVSGLRCDGHSANVRGTTVATSPLSRARAAFMCEALRKLGIRARTRLGDRGDSKPIAPNENESGRAANRRVQVSVTHRVRRLRNG